MNKGLGLLLAASMWVVSACASAAPSPAPTEAPPLPTTTPLSLLVPAEGSLTWERSGGIAGLCQQLTIHADGSYVFLDTCRSSPPQTGQLPQDEADQLQSWLGTYQSFTWATPRQPGSADMFTVMLDFQGIGSNPVTEDVQSMIVATIGQWASILAASPSPQATPISGQGIKGRATLGPTCPVARAEDPCPDKPYQGQIQVLDASGDVVTEFTPGPDGTFRVSLLAGSYVLRGASQGPFPRAPYQDVVVQPGEYAQVNLSFDTGIR